MAAMAHVDMLVLLPLEAKRSIEVTSDEDLALREAMNTALLDLAHDPDLVGDVVITEITGSRDERTAQLEEAVHPSER